MKEAYGVANLTTMQSIGEDFDLLTITLKDYGAALIEQGLLADAISVLELALPSAPTSARITTCWATVIWHSKDRQDLLSDRTGQIQEPHAGTKYPAAFAGAFVRRQHRRSRKNPGKF